ncbi:MAG TPA: glycosyl transferase family 2, partial [Ruminococcaceae bacterium]|nr:glycosyl transferase family 2 [Oscillospiraceae bacterium]
MPKYKICVYAICKNEEKFVERWMDSMSEADMIVVTDTGSTDQTVKKLRGRGAVVYEEKIKPWRFDTARNISLSHIPDDIDIAVCTDLDEIFRPGWRKALEKAWVPGTTTGNYLYNWSLNDDGTPKVQFTYFKIHTKADYTWSCPVHEYLQYIGNEPEKKVFIDGLILDHYPDKTKSRGSYLPLLETATREEPDNIRMIYYLGREYMYAGRWQDCIKTLKHYLEMPSAIWNEERCASMRWIAISYVNLDDMAEAYRWYYRAVAEAPDMRDPYIEFAKAAYDIKDWATVFYMINEALKIKERSTTYVNMAYSWDHTPYDLSAIACYNLGMYDKALTHVRSAIEMSPQDERLRLKE